MTAQERLKQITEKMTTCPICAGTGLDPVTKERIIPGPTPKTETLTFPCRRCQGTKNITRIRPMRNKTGVLTDHVIIYEELAPNGALHTHVKELSLITDRHGAVLAAAGQTNKKRMQNMRAAEDPVMQKALDRWISENR